MLLPELTTESVDSLLPLAAPLNLNKDDFYINLIHTILKSHKSLSSAAGNASDNTVDPQMAYELAISKTPTQFNAVQQLIYNLKDPESMIMATKHIADQVPCGPDRIAALKMAGSLMSKWRQYIKRMSEPERSRVATRAKAMAGLISECLTDTNIEIALRQRRLERYLALFLNVQDSESVIRALAAVFEDECDRRSTGGAASTSVSSAAGSSTSAATDNLYGALPQQQDVDPTTHHIHETLRNLAAIFEITLDTLMRELLNKYLMAPVTLSDTLVRVAPPHYLILSNQPPSEAVRALLCLGRARALNILFSVATDEEIATLQVPQDVHSLFQVMLYLDDFNHKDALARSIWVEHHEDPKVVQLICNMCLDFHVDDCDLIVQVIRRLLVAGMYRYVVGVLDVVGGMEEEYSGDIEELPEFWNQAVAGFMLQITTKLGSGNDDGDSSQVSANRVWIESALGVLDSCLRSIYLPDIDATQTISALLKPRRTKKRLSSASSLAPESPSASASAEQLACAVFDILLYSHAAEDVLLDHLDSLEPQDIHQLIIRYLDFIDCASTLPNSPLFQVLMNHHKPLGKAVKAFVSNRIARDKLQITVTACLDKGKDVLAVMLVGRYYETRPVHVLLEDIKRSGFIPVEDAAAAAAPLLLDVEGGESLETHKLSDAMRSTIEGLSGQNKLEIYLHSRAQASNNDSE
ncbi:hypothetical protein BX661DRAFT_177089 [Kickxella alabastrina]|uniref:uncharacterized protein n=1 Tax=Kickxella alabastrina TaxID=61397 RepID=UPI00221EA86B|nr:uncharacterized protein BX661DRAFT_177089 [Kickxella alabastrina]KAI7834365.1 hypothetical protein BX661DRAFT_177089 [Kickxella alabastrina]